MKSYMWKNMVIVKQLIKVRCVGYRCDILVSSEMESKGIRIMYKIRSYFKCVDIGTVVSRLSCILFM